MSKCVCQSFKKSIQTTPSLETRIIEDQTEQFIADNQKQFLHGLIQPVPLSAEQQKWEISLYLVKKLQKPINNVNQIGLFQGFSALHWAVFYNQAHIVEQLLAHNSDPNLKNRYGDTPTDFAIQHGREDILQLFFRHTGA